MTGEWIRDLPMSAYLGDRSRLSGSTLRMAGSDPERFGEWMSGKNDDRQSAAMAQGSMTHLIALGQGAGELADFGFYPSRFDALTEEKKMGPVGIRGGKPKMEKTGNHIQQDPTEAGKYKKALYGSAFEKAQVNDWLTAHRGKTIVYPESQPIIQAMARAIRNDPHAGPLLVGPEYEPEVTGHFVGDDGLLYRVRLDGLRAREDIVIELKTITPKYGRLDTSNEGAVMRGAREGWAIKSALYHDAFFAIEGRNATMVWILVEAVADKPRVSVVYDEAGSTMHEIGMHGYKDIPGYLKLGALAAALRDSGDFRHHTVREPQAKWAFPEYVEDGLSELTGMTEIEHGPT